MLSKISFLNFGDRFELPVVLQNQTDAPMAVDVAVRATNVTLAHVTATVTNVVSFDAQTVTVPANDRIEVRFPAYADQPGTAPLAYDPGFAAQQRAGYPDLKALTVADAPDVAYDKALAAAKTLGWAIIASDPARGRIEATDTVPWWGFHDDVVVRLTPSDGGTRIDVRSKSRVGKGDVGVNAKRIADFYAKVAKQ